MAFKNSGWEKSGKMQAKVTTKVKPSSVEVHVVFPVDKSKPLSTAKKKEKEGERKKIEAKKRDEKRSDWKRHQQGQGHRSKPKSQKPGENSLKAIKAKPNSNSWPFKPGSKGGG